MPHTTRIDEIDRLNKTDKQAGIKNFLYRLEFDFVRQIAPATRTGAGILYTLPDFGGIDTPGYSLEVTTNKGRKYQVTQNDTCIETGEMREFCAGQILKKITYRKEIKK